MTLRVAKQPQFASTWAIALLAVAAAQQAWAAGDFAENMRAGVSLNIPVGAGAKASPYLRFSVRDQQPQPQLDFRYDLNGSKYREITFNGVAVNPAAGMQNTQGPVSSLPDDGMDGWLIAGVAVTVMWYVKYQLAEFFGKLGINY